MIQTLFVLFVLVPIALVVFGPGMIGRLIGIVLLSFVVFLGWVAVSGPNVITAETTEGMMLVDVEVERYRYDHSRRLTSLTLRNNGDRHLTSATLLGETLECDSTGCLRIRNNEHQFTGDIPPGFVGELRSIGMAYQSPRRDINGGTLRDRVTLIELAVR